MKSLNKLFCLYFFCFAIAVNAFGMNRVVLGKSNVRGNKVLLKQEQFNKLENGNSVPLENTIFVIQYDFELAEDIKIPKGCVLNFDGGSLSGNHVLTGQLTSIDAGLVKIFDTAIVLKGDWNVIELYPEWFGALGDGLSNDIEAIQHTIDMASKSYTGVYSVKLINNKSYRISRHINIPPRINLSSTYQSRDKSNDGRNKPKIIVTGDDAIHFVTEKGLGNSLGFIVIDNIAILGSSPLSFKGIACEDKSAKYIEKCRLSGLYISNFKYGVYIEGADYILNGNVVDDLSVQGKIGLGIYLHTKDVYDLLIDNVHLFSPYIGGVWLETNNITTPISFRNCVMEGCGREYILSDYNTYGCFAIRVKSNTDLESVTIDKCYFEANAPIKKSKGVSVSKIESLTADKAEVYVRKPDWNKTADIVMEGPQVSVANTVFSELYQMIAINSAGKLVFENNVIYVPEGWKKYGMFTKSLVRVNDSRNSCKNIAVKIDLTNLTSQFLTRNKIDDLIEIQLAEGTIAKFISAYVSIPVLGKNYYYTNTTSGIYRTNVLYYDANAVDNGIGTPFSPIKHFDSLMKYVNSTFNSGDVVRIVLLSDVNVATETSAPAGVDFLFETIEGEKQISLRNPLNFFNSDINFNNVRLVKEDGRSNGDKGVLILNNSNIGFKNCKIVLNSNSALLAGENGGKAYFDGCTITPHDKNKHYLTDRTKGKVDVVIMGGTTLNGDISY